MMNKPSELSTSELAKDISSASHNFHTTKAKVLVVDNHPLSRTVVVDLLSLDGYEVLEADESHDIVEYIIEYQPDLVLLDVMMTQTNGFELCKHLKQHQKTQQIPIVLITVTDDRASRLRCIEVGGDDLMGKPLDRLELSARVKSLIDLKRLNEGLNQTEQVLFSLAKAIENRSSENGNGSSCARIASLVKSFGTFLELSAEDIENLLFAAHLHDIGTIGIPDAVLMKKGELTAQERELIRQHVLIGEQICQPLQNRSGVLPIIRHHHERWDGSGYPDGLKNHEIPRLAQIFQILDIYDALTSDRPHKQAYSPTQALEILSEETNKGWRNPEIFEQFTEFILALEEHKSPSLKSKFSHQ